MKKLALTLALVLMPISGQAATNPVSTFLKNINNVSLADLQNASALAHATNNIVTASCWDAWVALLQRQNAVQTSTTSPLGPIHIFTDAEKVSELIQSLQPGGAIQVGCAAMADATKKSVLQIVTGVITGVTALPLVPALP